MKEFFKKIWGTIKAFIEKRWQSLKEWFKNLNWIAFFGDRDIAYLFPFVVFVIQLILVKGNWLWDTIVLILYLPILYFGYLKEDEAQG